MDFAHEAGPVTILLIQDDEQLTYLLTFLLEREGFKVTVARDGQQAQQRVDTAPAPSAVITDLMLPYKTGYELIQHMRATPGWTAVPILVLTSKSGERDILRAFELGADDYVIKPFHPAELIARLRHHLRKAS